MPTQPLSLHVGGQTYRVLTDADPERLQRLAAIVDQRIQSLDPTAHLTQPQALLYVALALADELEAERELRSTLQTNATSSLHDLLHRIDAALDATAPLLAR